MATTSNKADYYEEFMKYYRQHQRLYPYHAADYVTREMRYPAFKYYSDVLFDNMKAERSYD